MSISYFIYLLFIHFQTYKRNVEKNKTNNTLVKNVEKPHNYNTRNKKIAENNREHNSLRNMLQKIKEIP